MGSQKVHQYHYSKLFWKPSQSTPVSTKHITHPRLRTPLSKTNSGEQNCQSHRRLPFFVFLSKKYSQIRQNKGWDLELEASSRLWPRTSMFLQGQWLVLFILCMPQLRQLSPGLRKMIGNGLLTGSFIL